MDGMRSLRPVEERAEEIASRLEPGAKMAEIGVLTGALSDLVLRRCEGLRIAMVDNWLPQAKQPASYIATRDEHARHDLSRARAHRQQAEKVAAHWGGQALIMPMSSARAAGFFAPGSFDLVFLDADHSYEGVRDDIAAWAPLVRSGGWLGGHDYANGDPRFDFSGVSRAVDETFPARELGRNFTWWVRL